MVVTAEYVSWCLAGFLHCIYCIRTENTERERYTHTHQYCMSVDEQGIENAAR